MRKIVVYQHFLGLTDEAAWNKARDHLTARVNAGVSMSDFIVTKSTREGYYEKYVVTVFECKPWS